MLLSKLLANVSKCLVGEFIFSLSTNNIFSLLIHFSFERECILIEDDGGALRIVTGAGGGFGRGRGDW